MSIEDSIKQEIAYCESKVIEYERDAREKTSGKVLYWQGKADTHKYIAIRLKRVLEWHESKPKN